MKIVCIALVGWLVSFCAECAVEPTCSSNDADSLVEVGIQHQYHFHSDVYAEAVGTTNDCSRLSIDCNISLSKAHECSYALNLNRCTLTAAGGEPENEEAWISGTPFEELTKYPLLFSWYNGEVSEIYTHEDDPVHIINIKRGILSAFVFKFSYALEETIKEYRTDVHGTCPISVKATEESVQITKDMLHCSFPSRMDWQFSPWSLFWNMSFIQYVINSTTECDYKIDKEENKIFNVFCKERHAIMLESTHNTTTAVQANVLYRMNYLQSERQNEQPNYSHLTRKSGIQFEYERTPKPLTDPEEFFLRAKKMIFDLSSDASEQIRLFTIPQFTDLVAWIRTARDLEPLVESIRSCQFLPDGTACTDDIRDLALSFLEDALVQCNTVPCVKAVTYMMRNDYLSPSYTKFVYYSWSNMHFAEPEILLPIMDLCKRKDSQECWLTVGTLAQRIHLKLQDFGNLGENDQVLDGLRKVSGQLNENIQGLCAPENFDALESDTKKYEDLLTYLKAVRNMGSMYLELIPDATKILIGCAKETKLPTYIRAAVLQVLQDVSSCRKLPLTCNMIFDGMLPLFTSLSESTTTRALSYDLLMSADNISFAQYVIDVLQKEENLQLKAYVASSLEAILADGNSLKNHKEFIDLIQSLLRKNNLSLEVIVKDSGSSTSSSFEAFTELPLPEELNGFGLRAETAKVYDAYGALPSFFRIDIILKLFNKIIPAFQGEAHFQGLEEIAISLHKIFSSIKFEPSTYADIYGSVTKFLQLLQTGMPQESVEYKFDQDIVRNIRKLESSYRKFKPKLKPFMNAYVNLFGSTVTFLTSGDITKLLSNVNELYHLLDYMKNGVKYDTTRVFRVIEAYHQVPTLMGLPLNWTTNATLALSLRSGLKAEVNPKEFKVHVAGILQPSVALTFLNRMVIDLPTITQIGVQANSSAYSSTQWMADLNAKPTKISFRMEKPQKTQSVLELFRTNQLIKHEKYIDIPDWDIERTSSSWCSGGDINSVLGMQLCIEKSYPKVTHLLKPWALMAGSCKWQCQMRPFNNKIQFYEIHLKNSLEEKTKTADLEFSTKGDSVENKISFNINLEQSNDGTKFEIKSGSLPDFTASYTSNSFKKNKKIGHRLAAILGLSKGFQYKVDFTQEERIELLPDFSVHPNALEDDHKLTTVVQEHLLLFESPYNAYELKKEHFTQGESTQTDFTLLYESFSPRGKWLATILPREFWESGSKAWLQARMLWKSPLMRENSIDRQTVFLVKMPGSNMEMNANGIEMPDKEQIAISLRKTETKNQKLLGFVDFSYEYWKNSSEQALIENRLINLTVSQRSWAAQLEKYLSEKQSKFVVSLKKSIMSPKTEENIYYVGWWNKKGSEHFASEESEVTFSVDLETQMMSGDDLAEKYPTVDAKDVENLLNQLIVTKVMLSYPFYQNKEAVTFDGYYILSGGADIFRFQEKSVISSSYHGLEIISHSVYKSDPDMRALDHISEFVHLETEKKAFHILEYKTLHPAGQCTESRLRHYIRAPVFHLSSRVDRWCHSEDPQLYTLTLNITTQSSCWGLLKSKTDQFIQEIRTDYAYEECHYENPLATIDVRAEWFGEKNVDHNKTAMFCNKNNDCAKLYLETKHYGYSSLDLSTPAEDQPFLSFKKKVSAEYPNIDIQVQYRDTEDEMDVLRVMADASNANNPVWSGIFDTLAFQKVKNTFSPVWSKVTDAVKSVSQETNHPLNVILKPILKKSLYELWQDLNIKRTELEKEVWADLGAVMYRIQPFFSSLQTVVSNSLTVTKQSIWKIYNTLKDKSVIVWALDYFEVPYYLQWSFETVPLEVKNFVTQKFMKDERFIQFQFTTATALKLASSEEWRSISSQYINKYFSTSHRKENSEAHYRPSPSVKVGMIFGPTHVYTFDEHLYSVPPYPHSDCVLLLAHDLHNSQFTVLSTQEFLHVLFPEMSVTINSKNEVFINGNDVASITPIQADNGKVIITRGSNLHIWSPSLQITCSSRDFLCIFELKLWHMGATIGLLGDADGISTNDYKLPDGKTGNLLDFVNSYDVSGNPVCKEFASVSTPEPSKENEEVCSELFRDICPDNKRITKLLYDVCVEDVAMGSQACYAASALSALCYYKNSDSSSDCHGKKQESQAIGQKLEVVLMVQEHKSMVASNKNKILKGLENLCLSVEKQFKDRGYSSVSFSLVGFGGQGSHYPATVHSREGNMWHEIQEITDVIKSLEFKGTTEADTIETLKFVSEVLGYDAFVSKVFVVVVVNDKQVQNKKQTDGMMNFLEANGITLYTISSYPAIAKKQKVFGVRADGLIFPSDKTGDAYLDYPKGALAKLTSATRGSVFLSKFLLDNEPDSYFKEIAKEIWAKVSKEAQSCKTCKNVRSGWWWNVNECSIEQC